MIFDFSDVSDQGYTVLPPDRYAVITTDEWWLRKKEETGNMIIDMDVEVTAGKYKGETTRYFHTITNDDTTLGFLLRFLRSIGIIKDGDRKPDGALKVQLNYGEKDQNGRVRITSISVNEDQRVVAGWQALAVVTERVDQSSGEKRSNISRFEAVDADAPAGAAPDAPASASKPPNRGAIPF